MRWLASLLLLVGCALRPGPPGSEARVVVMRPLTAAEHARDVQWRSEAERRRDAATGLRELAAQGRVVVTRCALSDFEVVFHLAVLPPGAAMPANGALLRVRLGDAMTPDVVLGRVTEPPELVEGMLARGWERSLSVPLLSPVPVEAEVAPFVARHYHKVRNVHLLACTPKG